VPVGRTLVGGSPYLGVFVRADERCAIVPPSLPGALERDLARILGVDVVRTTVADSDVVGALVAVNSRGVVVGEGIDPAERHALERVGPVTDLRHRHNAIGNNVLVNDLGALVHPEYSNEALEAIGRALGVRVERGTLAGLATVGMAGVATNLGAVVHPKATDRELARAEEVLGVPVARSTANFGVPVVGACVVANSRGILVGLPTTPVEIVHLQDGLRLVV
jgi:translation initiation factor 6